MPNYCKDNCMYIKRDWEKKKYCFQTSSKYPDATPDKFTALWYSESDSDCEKDIHENGQGFTIDVEVNTTDVPGNVNFAISFNSSQMSYLQFSGDYAVRFLELDVEFKCTDNYPINYPVLDDSHIAPVACFAEEKIEPGRYQLEVKNKNTREDGSFASPEDEWIGSPRVCGMLGGECHGNEGKRNGRSGRCC